MFRKKNLKKEPELNKTKIRCYFNVYRGYSWSDSYVHFEFSPFFTKDEAEHDAEKNKNEYQQGRGKLRISYFEAEFEIDNKIFPDSFKIPPDSSIS